MHKPILISQKEARKIILHSQGLYKNWNNTLDVIKQLSYVQIDTISVTERSHNHILYNRNTDFKQGRLLALMSNKAIFEYWSHAAAYLPMEDYRFSLLKKKHYRNGGKHWFPRDKKVEKYVIDKIKAEGPLKSKDFISNKNHKNLWFEWKPTKVALTNLFMDGSLMIANREGFQKIFDITERVLPSNINTTIPTKHDYCKHLIKNAIKSQGVVTISEIGYKKTSLKPYIKNAIKELIENNNIIEVNVIGNDNLYFSTKEKLNLINNTNRSSNEIQILNPFDNLLIQRKRIKELFNFDYMIECYVPQRNRKFGYYTLPVLYGDKFVLRLDAKADRKTGIFNIKNIWFEKGFQTTKDFNHALKLKLLEFSYFCGCQTINKKFD